MLTSSVWLRVSSISFVMAECNLEGIVRVWMRLLPIALSPKATFTSNPCVVQAQERRCVGFKTGICICFQSLQ